MFSMGTCYLDVNLGRNNMGWFRPSLEIGPPMVPRESNDISDVVETCGEKYHPLQTQAEPAVVDGSIASEVQVLVVLLQGQTSIENPVFITTR